MWRNDLRAIVKIDLKPVIMGRIVARSNHGTAACLILPYRKAQLRRRARPFENQCLTSELTPC